MVLYTFQDPYGLLLSGGFFMKNRILKADYLPAFRIECTIGYCVPFLGGSRVRDEAEIIVLNAKKREAGKGSALFREERADALVAITVHYLHIDPVLRCMWAVIKWQTMLRIITPISLLPSELGSGRW